MRWRRLLRIGGVGALALAGSACDPVAFIGLLPFSGQTQVPADAMIRVNYGDSVDLDGVALTETVRLRGQGADWPLALESFSDGVAWFQPLEPLAPDAFFALSASLGGFHDDGPLVQGGNEGTPMNRGTTFSTGGTCMPLGWESISTESSMRGRVLFSCPPTADWVVENLRLVIEGQDVVASGRVPEFIAEPDHPYILEAWGAPPADAAYYQRDALWVRAGERWREVPTMESGEMSAARGDVESWYLGCL